MSIDSHAEQPTISQPTTGISRRTLLAFLGAGASTLAVGGAGILIGRNSAPAESAISPTALPKPAVAPLSPTSAPVAEATAQPTPARLASFNEEFADRAIRYWIGAFGREEGQDKSGNRELGYLKTYKNPGIISTEYSYPEILANAMTPEGAVPDTDPLKRSWRQNLLTMEEPKFMVQL
jgi:hypothetical protein